MQNAGLRYVSGPAFASIIHMPKYLGHRAVKILFGALCPPPPPSQGIQIYLYIQYFTSISELATRNNWFDNMILVQGPKTVSLNGIETPF